MAQWFLLNNEQVKGPFTEDQIKSDLRSGRGDQDSLVWGRLLQHWLPLRQWQTELPNLLKRAAESKDLRSWHYAVDGSTYGPFTRAQLIKEIAELRSKNELLIWTKGMPSWGHIYEFQDLMEEVGVSRRQHPRAAITGSAVIKSADKTLLGQLVTISPGGCGVVGVEGLAPGEKMSLDLKSDAFNETLRLRAEVRYVTDSHFVGIKFENISTEALSRIIEYIKGAGATQLRAA